MFKVPDGSSLRQGAAAAEQNYVIQKNDVLKLSVYTNKGELIIDPEYRLLKDLPAQNITRPDNTYLVDGSGTAKFPMIDPLRVEGLSLRQAEEILQKEYARFYSNPFVVLQWTNKRVVVLGAPGGKVIPLTNENTSLAEVIALAGGLGIDAKAHAIRVLRDNEFFVADFSTVNGYQQTNMIMQPGDIIYIEPVRRPASEVVRDYGPIVSIITSLTTLIVVLVSL